MLGDILKELRSVTGETQDTVAKKLGISRAAYSHLENNRNEPDNEMLTKLANHYQVTTDYLLGRPEQKQKKTNKLTVEEALSHVMSYDGKKIHEDDIGPLTEIIKRMMK